NGMASRRSTSTTAPATKRSVRMSSTNGDQRAAAKVVTVRRDVADSFAGSPLPGVPERVTLRSTTPQGAKRYTDELHRTHAFRSYVTFPVARIRRAIKEMTTHCRALHLDVFLR